MRPFLKCKKFSRGNIQIVVPTLVLVLTHSCDHEWNAEVRYKGFSADYETCIETGVLVGSTLWRVVFNREELHWLRGHRLEVMKVLATQKRLPGSNQRLA